MGNPHYLFYCRRVEYGGSSTHRLRDCQISAIFAVDNSPDAGRFRYPFKFLPLPTSQIRTVWSSLPVTICRPSGLKARSSTVLEWITLQISSPVLTRQTDTSFGLLLSAI